MPCSRVSHVYRGHSCSSCGSGTLANKFKGVPTTLRNYKRVVEVNITLLCSTISTVQQAQVWFDEEYKEFFYTREPLARLIDHGDISKQLQLKKDKNCKSFDWFMTEIAYDVFEKYPKVKRTAWTAALYCTAVKEILYCIEFCQLPPNKHWGELKNAALGLCVDTMGRHPPSQIGASGCHGGGGYQLLQLNTKGQVALACHVPVPQYLCLLQLSNGEWCVKAESAQRVTIAWCEMGQVGSSTALAPLTLTAGVGAVELQ